jgi:hypothetical protein
MSEQAMHTAIGLELVFGPFHRSPVLSTSPWFRFYNTWIEIDGVRHEREGGSWHVFEVTPGWHLVRVFFRYRPWIFPIDLASQQAQIEVPPGQMARLKYEGSALWPMLGASLVQLDPSGR